MKVLKNKYILITAGHKRVGKAIAMHLAGLGANIFITYGQDEKTAIETSSEIRKLGAKVSAFHLDQSDINSVKELVKNIYAATEHIYGLVNNAAIFYKTPVRDISENDFDNFINTNLKGPFFLAKLIGEKMFANGEGRIVNIADVSVDKVWMDYIPYTISKAGIVAMTKGLAKAFAPHVLVNAVSPGTVMLADNYDAAEEQYLIDRTPLKKTGTPDHIASTVTFLMSGNDFIHGTVINVDGGRSIT